MNFRVVIPTYNAEGHLGQLIPALEAQGIPMSSILVIDSSSGDRTRELVTAAGMQLHTIPQSEFSHGGTRMLGAEMCSDAEVIVYLTQDAIPCDDNAISNLVEAFDDDEVGLAFGRQMPRPEANSIERHARLFNYGDTSYVRNWSDRERFGIKTVFCSNSFAAYRTRVLMDCGGFPRDAFFAEDQIVAARIVKSGKRLAYAADARVTHSHGYTVREEFRRYFDVGAFHAENASILEDFGHAESEGRRFLLSELRYVAARQPWLLPSAMIRTVAKYTGYKVGMNHRSLKPGTKARLSMSGRYWLRDSTTTR